MKRWALPGRWVVILLLGTMIIALTWAVFGDRGLMHLYELHRLRDDIRRENIALTEQNSELKRQIELLHHDVRYLERIAREELGLINPNEIVFRFSQQPPSSTAGEPVLEKQSDHLP